LKSIFVLAAAGLLATAAHADGLYASVGGGLSKYDMDCGGTTACDNSGKSLRAAFGWQANPILGVEAIYLNLGKTTASINDASVGRIDMELKASFIGAAAVMRLPLAPSLDMDLRLGGGQVKSKAQGSAMGFTVALPSEDKFQLLAGLGLSYAITPQVKLQAQWEATKAEIEGEKANVNALNFGVRWDF
jgi:opacity protein-like surface antigen